MSRIGSLKMLLSASSMLVGAIIFAGCGSSSDSTFSDGTQGQNVYGGKGGFDDGTGNGDPNGNGGSSSGGAGDVGNVDPNSACATASDGAVLQPISLVFMIDRSGSMGQNGNLAKRWTPVKEGLTTFFGDPASSYVSASLAFFPIIKSKQLSCSSSDYQNAVVPMTQLPDANAFSSAFNTGPSGNTPTEPALKGAIDAATAVKAAGKNVAVVFATDGEPNDDCGPGGTSSTVSGAEKIATAGVNAGVKTYVIGVGKETGNLNTIAQAGGTGTAIMIPTDDPQKVSADLLAAIGQIASSLLGCNYGLPAPPTGQTLDVNAVNVNYTPPGGGASKTLPYSADCSNPEGWKYDNVAAPKEVILCGNSCNTAKSQAGAKLDIIFGCATAVTPGGTDPNGNVH